MELRLGFSVYTALDLSSLFVDCSNRQDEALKIGLFVYLIINDVELPKLDSIDQ